MLVNDFFNTLVKHNVTSFFGVPDSLLKSFCSYIYDNTNEYQHVITANEGNAIALAAGHYLATSNIALVYMQNSGIGNAINPILSLTDKNVYNIPFLMIIGWRGEPGVPDEPQHIKQGQITEKLLETIGIKYSILPNESSEANKSIENAFRYMNETKNPYAFLIKKDTFDHYQQKKKQINNYELSREEAVDAVLKIISSDDVIVATTGQISRELYEGRGKRDGKHNQDFLSVGSMGHASSIAMAVAIEKKYRKVYCFDGDGALLMHMGSLPVIASRNLANFKYILFNNEVHDSVGGQPTAMSTVDFHELVKSFGVKNIYMVSSFADLDNVLNEFAKTTEMAFLEIKVKRGARADLGRPKEKPIENKQAFMQFINPQRAYVYRNSVNELSHIIKENNMKKILLFHGKKSFEQLKKNILPQLSGVVFDECYNFTVNPKYDEIISAVNEYKSENYDAIIAIGGGSVIDFAKAYKFYSKNKPYLVAIPTTFGTGSEATQFAVVYINGKKHSLDDIGILPECAICDSNLAIIAPKYVKACTAMDTFCQAMESIWAVKSTEESRSYAEHSISLCRDNIEGYVLTDKTEFSENMATAAYLSGKAINITRTTAAHALSYKITTDYNIPHGHAVALSIAGLFKLNLNVDVKTCQDIRGVDYVKKTMHNLLALLRLDETNVELYFKTLMENIGLTWCLSDLNINDKSEIINAIDKDRLSNNPLYILDNLEKIWL